MSYAENRDRLCRKMKVQNPILEEDVPISELFFLQISGGMLEEATCIQATEKNIAGRLWIEFLRQFYDPETQLRIGRRARKRYSQWEDASLQIIWAKGFQIWDHGDGRAVYLLPLYNRYLRLLNEWHFAELWNDAEEAGRGLIIGIKEASYVGIVYKKS